MTVYLHHANLHVAEYRLDLPAAHLTDGDRLIVECTSGDTVAGIVSLTATGAVLELDTLIGPGRVRVRRPLYTSARHVRVGACA